jgi:hypothetical protein
MPDTRKLSTDRKHRPSTANQATRSSVQGCADPWSLVVTLLTANVSHRRCSRKWAHRNRRFLELVHMSFADTGTWPCAETLQRELLHLRDTLDVFERAKQLPPSLGGIGDDGRVYLTVTALAQLDAAHELLDDFLRAVQLAVSKYRDGDRETKPTLSERDLIDDLSISDRRASRVMWLMSGGHPPFEALNGGTCVAITSDARHFVTVRGIQSYLKTSRPLERRHHESAGTRAVGQIRKWLGRRQIAIWEWIVIAILAGLVVAAATWGISQLTPSSAQHGSPAGHTSPSKS